MKIEDIIQFLLFGSETCNKVTLDKEDVKILLNYIADLQRKEYNNSKAIEYVETFKNDIRGLDEYVLLDILKGE